MDTQLHEAMYCPNMECDHTFRENQFFRACFTTYLHRKIVERINWKRGFHEIASNKSIHRSEFCSEIVCIPGGLYGILQYEL